MTIECVTQHQINNDDTGHSYRVDVLHLSNGEKIGYWADDATPVESGIIAALCN